MSKLPDISGLNLKQLNDLIELAQLQKDEITKAEEASFMEEIKELADKRGLDFATLMKGMKKKPKTKLPPKFRNPENPTELWTGRGQRPKWLRALIEQGHKLEEYAI